MGLKMATPEEARQEQLKRGTAADPQHRGYQDAINGRPMAEEGNPLYVRGYKGGRFDRIILDDRKNGKG